MQLRFAVAVLRASPAKRELATLGLLECPARNGTAAPLAGHTRQHRAIVVPAVSLIQKREEAQAPAWPDTSAAYGICTSNRALLIHLYRLCMHGAHVDVPGEIIREHAGYRIASV